MLCAAPHLTFTFHTAGTFYNLPVTFSPEYAKDNNTNYDLALFRWGLQTLLGAFETLGTQGKPKGRRVACPRRPHSPWLTFLWSSFSFHQDPRQAQYADVLKRLAPYPVGDNGFMIAQSESRRANDRLTLSWMTVPHNAPLPLVKTRSSSPRATGTTAISLWFIL